MARGGARQGAGRPKKEPTKAIRVPIAALPKIEKLIHQTFNLPFYSGKVSAGFPTPTDEYLTDHVDLNEYLVKQPATTFLVRATGTSMINAGIHENDLLVVDRGLTPSNGKVVIVAIDGQLTVKRLVKSKLGKYILMAENPNYPDIEVPENSETVIWGVVTQVIHSL